MRRSVCVLLVLVLCISLVGCGHDAGDRPHGTYELVLTAQQKAEIMMAGVRATYVSKIFTCDDKTNTFTISAFGFAETEGTYTLKDGILTLVYTRFGEEFTEELEYRNEGKTIWIGEEEYTKKK